MKLSIFTKVALVGILFLSSSLVYFDTKNLYHFLIVVTSWFADLVKIISLLLKSESELILNQNRTLGFVLKLIIIKSIFGLINIYLIFLSSLFKEWWAKVATVLGSICWILIGYVSLILSVI